MNQLCNRPSSCGTPSLVASKAITGSQNKSLPSLRQPVSPAAASSATHCFARRTLEGCSECWTIIVPSIQVQTTKGYCPCRLPVSGMIRVPREDFQVVLGRCHYSLPVTIRAVPQKLLSLDAMTAPVSLPIFALLHRKQTLCSKASFQVKQHNPVAQNTYVYN